MPDKLELEKLYALSPMQEGMLFHALLDQDSKAYFEQLSFDLDGPLDIGLFEMSFHILIERYEIFRTVFVYDKINEPRQVVLKKRVARINFEDISFVDENSRHAIIEKFKNEHSCNEV